MVRVYTVCNVAVSSVDDCLRTPFIVTHSVNRLHVRIDFTMCKCTKYPNQQCKQSLKLLCREVENTSEVEGDGAADATAAAAAAAADDDDILLFCQIK